MFGPRGSVGSGGAGAPWLAWTTEAAFGVLTSTSSQMEAVQKGHVRTEGSPEYTRKLSILMQKVDELLSEG